MKTVKLEIGGLLVIEDHAKGWSEGRFCITSIGKSARDK
jgi:hypothetical protein